MSRDGHEGSAAPLKSAAAIDLVESHDLEPIHNHIIRQEKRRRHKDRRCYGYSGATFTKHVITIMIGVMTAVIAFGMGNVVSYMITGRNYLIHMAIKSRWGAWGGLATNASWTLFFCIIPGLLVKFYAPAAGGGGVTLVMAILNGNHVPDVLRRRTLFVKVVGTTMCVGSGIAVGPEAPLIFVGTAVASLLAWFPLRWIDGGGFFSRPTPHDYSADTNARALPSRRRPLTGGPNHMPKREIVDLISDDSRRELLSAGAAAGLAAAFGTPIGGVLFAVEEAISAWNRKVVWRCFLAAGTSSFLLSQLSGLSGKTGFLSFYGIHADAHWIRQLPLFILTAATAGVIGSIFNVLHRVLARVRAPHHKRWHRIAEILLVAIISVLIMYGIPWAKGTCVPIPANWHEKNSLVDFGCPIGYYNDLATFFLGEPESTIRKLLSLGSDVNDSLDEDQMHPTNLLLFVVGYFIMMSLAFGTAIPGGVFLPSVMLGAAWGSLTAIVYKKLLPTYYLSINPIQPGLFALIGATSTLTGVMRSTISLVVIMVEGTDGIDFIFPIIIAVVVGNWASHHIFEHSIYEADLERESSVAFLPPEPPSETVYLTAEDIMEPCPITIRVKEPYRVLLKILESCRHNGFPVVEHIDGARLLRGMILRSQLIVLLKHIASNVGNRRMQRAMSDDLAGDNISLTGVSNEEKHVDLDMRLYHARRNTHRRQLCSHRSELVAMGLVGDVGLPGSLNYGSIGNSALDDDQMVDVSPYMNLAPLSVSENCNVSRVHTLFRAMQLRHLCVVNDQAAVVGIITRKDLQLAYHVNVQEYLSIKRRQAYDKATAASSHHHHPSAADEETAEGMHHHSSENGGGTLSIQSPLVVVGRGYSVGIDRADELPSVP